ncbi:hypothetical protein BH11PSE11_BH11PSE11_38660 [soil metagenome]
MSLTLTLACICICLPVHGQTAPATPATIVLSADQDETTFAGKWVWLIYSEAFKRLGMSFQLSANPLVRQSMLADEGAVDGEASRVEAYAAGHPNLIRVEEAVLDLGFSLYTANPALRVADVEDLKTTRYLAEYRRGIGVCETVLKRLFPAERLSDVTSPEQGARKLLAGRTDLYCDNDITMVRILHAPDIERIASVRKLIPLGAVIPTYPYLHRKHRDLAPRLAMVLKQMKSEDLVERYRLQAERDMGWRK